MKKGDTVMVSDGAVLSISKIEKPRMVLCPEGARMAYLRRKCNFSERLTCLGKSVS
jgi:hypothetical protein